MSYLDPYVKSTRQLFDKNEVIEASEIVAVAEEGWNHPKYTKLVHSSLRTIRNELIRDDKQPLYSHTISIDYIYALRHNRVDLSRPHEYIPAGKREVWGLRKVTDISDPIYIESRSRESSYSAHRIVTNCNRAIGAKDAKLLALGECEKLVSTALLAIANIEGNGMVTEILSKTLNIRIKIEHI